MIFQSTIAMHICHKKEIVSIEVSQDTVMLDLQIILQVLYHDPKKIKREVHN